MSKASKGNWKNPKIRKKFMVAAKAGGIKTKERWKNQEYRDRVSKAMSEGGKGKVLSEKHKRKIKRAVRRTYNAHPEIGMHISQIMKARRLSIEHKRRIGETNKRDWEQRPELREKASRSGKDRWKDDEYIKKWRKSNKIKPTKPEKQLYGLLQKHFPNEWKYVGDFSFWVSGRNPDFVYNNGRRLLIELFGDYWHSEKVKGKTVEEQLRERVNHFAKHGYKTLIIWEAELKNEALVTEKVIGFVNS